MTAGRKQPPSPEGRILEAAGRSGRHLLEIAEVTGLPTTTVWHALVRLSREGLVERTSAGLWKVLP